MLLPNAEHAFVDLRKLADYSLAPTHPVGRHKAIVFRSALGFTADDADTLHELLLRAVLVHDAVAGRFDEFGQRYTVDFPVATKVVPPSSVPRGCCATTKTFLASPPVSCYPIDTTLCLRNHTSSCSTPWRLSATCPSWGWLPVRSAQ